MGVLDPVFAPAAPFWLSRQASGIAGLVAGTPALGADPAAAVFVAPASGIVFITVTADMRPSAGQNIIVDWRVREGNTPGAGTIVDSTFDAGFTHQNFGRMIASPAGNPGQQMSCGPHPVTGLTPGAQYVAEFLGRGTGTVTQRTILVVPSLYGP